MLDSPACLSLPLHVAFTAMSMGSGNLRQEMARELLCSRQHSFSITGQGTCTRGSWTGELLEDVHWKRLGAALQAGSLAYSAAYLGVETQNFVVLFLKREPQWNLSAEMCISSALKHRSAGVLALKWQG